jgi:plastocyanin
MKTKLLGLMALVCLLGVSNANAATYTEVFSTNNPLLTINIGDTVAFAATNNFNSSGGDYLDFGETSPFPGPIVGSYLVLIGSPYDYTFAQQGTYYYYSDIANYIGNGGGSSIDVVTPTPLPAALPLFASGLGALGLLGWRRKRKASAIAA